MKPALIYALILALAFLKGNDHCFSPLKQVHFSSSAPYYQYNNIANSTHKRSPVDLFALTACCDDDDDNFETVKKKTGAIVSFLLTDIFKKVSVHSELKPIQHVSEFSDHLSQPVYIFQRELLI